MTMFILYGLLINKTSLFDIKIILWRSLFINLPVFTGLQNSPLCDFHYLLSKYKFQVIKRYTPAVLSLIFLSLHLIALSIMWTAWDYSTWYEEASGRTLQQQLGMKVWHTCKTIFQFFPVSSFGPTIIYYY